MLWIHLIQLTRHECATNWNGMCRSIQPSKSMPSTEDNKSESSSSTCCNLNLNLILIERFNYALGRRSCRLTCISVCYAHTHARAIALCVIVFILHIRFRWADKVKCVIGFVSLSPTLFRAGCVHGGENVCADVIVHHIKSKRWKWCTARETERQKILFHL